VAYSSSLVIYTSRRDETTTEESDATSQTTSQPTQHPETFPSSDYASLSDVQPFSDPFFLSKKYQRQAQDELLYQPVKHPERVFKVRPLLQSIFLQYYFT